MPHKILIIRHGALGDLFQAFEAFASIRHAFPHAHITLLTASPYHELASCCPWFDAIATDDRPPITNLRHWLRIRRLLREMDMVFDLQNSGRTARYFRLIRPGTAWSGQNRRASLPHRNPQARQMHTLMRQADQLRAAGVPLQPRTVPDFLTGQGPRLPSPYIVLVPGAAPHRPAKRWPAPYFATLAQTITTWGYQPVIIGSTMDRPLAETIHAQTPQTLDLTGRTSLPALAGLLHRATFCIGNDTGPLHIAAAMDCPTLTLFSATSNPRRCAPLGITPGRSRVLACPDLPALAPERVIKLLESWGHPLMQARTMLHNKD
ncbi:glycosyltransferase family 9 protein [Bombella favorum]|uniref:ADP-heptose--LPS heptosyltransferase n=1 Tax=Bombella favorum TaxID=2039164 RepID=A0ABR5ZNT7_9PROT|nr:glycosyltransferase family 9 protein [Bombella favorum]MBA5725988.1 ADP-heptose--LPS heptosyltransferase [Bombella favorum]